MKITTVAAAVLSLAFLAACGKNDQRPAASGSSATPPQSSTTPSTPSASSTPPAASSAGKTDHPPVQGQVDAKQSEQHKDFKTDGK